MKSMLRKEEMTYDDSDPIAAPTSTAGSESMTYCNLQV